MQILHAWYERLPVNLSSMLLYFLKSSVIFYYIFSQYPPYEGFIVLIVVRELKARQPPPSRGRLPGLGGVGTYRDLVKNIQNCLWYNDQKLNIR